MLHIPKDNKLDQHKILELKLLELFNQDEIKISELESILNKISTLNGKERKTLSNKTFIGENSEPKISKELIDKYENITNLLKNISSEDELTISTGISDKTPDKNNKIATIEINKIIDFFKFFSSEILKTESDLAHLINVDNRLALLTSQTTTIPITFKSGKKILFSPYNFNLDHFNYSELVELLRLLDVIDSGIKYDYLKIEIVKQINLVSSISRFRQPID